MRTVLDAVCESIGCRWSVEAGTPTKLRIAPSARALLPEGDGPEEPIDLRVTKANVRQVLQTLGQILSAAVEILLLLAVHS